MAITINQEQRDAIWADIELNHSGISDIEMGFTHGDSDDFREMRARFEQHWRLLDDLGWPRADVREKFTLTMPAIELENAMRWHRERATGSLEGHREDLNGAPEVPADIRQDMDQCLDLISACDRVLEQVGSRWPAGQRVRLSSARRSGAPYTRFASSLAASGST
jgi:hypothetical protein